MNGLDEHHSSSEEKSIEAGHHEKFGRDIIVKDGEIVNASGHRDQLQRQYGLISICGLALTIDNAWVALGGSLIVSIREQFSSGYFFLHLLMSTAANGGPPGVLYELLVACIYYGFIAASIAEVLVATPSTVPPPLTLLFPS